MLSLQHASRYKLNHQPDISVRSTYGVEKSLRNLLTYLLSPTQLGRICRTDASDHNNCVKDLIGQITSKNRLNISSKDQGFRFPHPGGYGVKNHNQGVAATSRL